MINVIIHCNIVATMSPIIINNAAEMRAFSREKRKMGKTIGFVPTMVGVFGCVDMFLSISMTS